MTLDEALAAQREAQAAYAAQLAAFAAERPDLERIAELGATAEAALARSLIPPQVLDDAGRAALGDEARRTAALLQRAQAAALAHVERLAGEVARGERAGEALRAYLPQAAQPPPRYLDERR